MRKRKKKRFNKPPQELRLSTTRARVVAWDFSRDLNHRRSPPFIPNPVRSPETSVLRERSFGLRSDVRSELEGLKWNPPGLFPPSRSLSQLFQRQERLSRRCQNVPPRHTMTHESTYSLMSVNVTSVSLWQQLLVCLESVYLRFHCRVVRSSFASLWSKTTKTTNFSHLGETYQTNVLIIRSFSSISQLILDCLCRGKHKVMYS